MAYALSIRDNAEFTNTGDKIRGVEDDSTGPRAGGAKFVWCLHPELVPEAREDWGSDGKPRSQKRKWMNAKERAKGYDGVAMKISG